MKRLYWDRHVPERIWDALADPRLPQGLPRTLYRRIAHRTRQRSIEAPATVRVCLTFDVEGDFRSPATTRATAEFLPRFQQWIGAHGWKTTLYVQGSIVSEFADVFGELQGDHELGLHGLYHEVWGRARWWQYGLRYPPLPKNEKRERLAKALDMFDMAGLRRPRSFRAPYLNADASTLDLLAEYDFWTDSSASSYLGDGVTRHLASGMWHMNHAFVHDSAAIQARLGVLVLTVNLSDTFVCTHLHPFSVLEDSAYRSGGVNEGAGALDEGRSGTLLTE